MLMTREEAANACPAVFLCSERSAYNMCYQVTTEAFLQFSFCVFSRTDSCWLSVVVYTLGEFLFLCLRAKQCAEARLGLAQSSPSEGGRRNGAFFEAGKQRGKRVVCTMSDFRWAGER